MTKKWPSQSGSTRHLQRSRLQLDCQIDNLAIQISLPYKGVTNRKVKRSRRDGEGKEKGEVMGPAGLLVISFFRFHKSLILPEVNLLSSMNILYGDLPSALQEKILYIVVILLLLLFLEFRSK